MSELFNYEKIRGEVNLAIPIEEYDEMKYRFEKLEHENWELRTENSLMRTKLNELGFYVTKTYLGNDGYSVKSESEREKVEENEVRSEEPVSR